MDTIVAACRPVITCDMSKITEESATGELIWCTAPLSRRRWLTGATVAGAAIIASPLLARLAWAADMLQPQLPTAMTVFKSPTCGCCKLWVDHVTAAGFKCTVRDTDDLHRIKQTFGVPSALQSCHTSQIGTYLVEGHVPADLIQKMLREKPQGRGLAVPGMPVGSPGMEGGTPERYQVLLFDQSGKTRVYATR